MKKSFLNTVLVLVLAFAMSSCYTYTYNVGQGAKSGVKTTEKNHYLIYGLAPINISNPIEMAGDATDYSVKIEHTFLDGLLNAITFGIYTPTTTTVTK